MGKGRPGTRVSAAPLAGSHSLVAYLAERKTADGVLAEAFASVDDMLAVRISEEGAGATGVALAPRGAGVMALLIDARSAHADLEGRQTTGALVLST